MTIEKFRGQAKCIIDQYDKYKLPGIDLYINGRMTQGENIADNGGLKQVTGWPCSGSALASREQRAVQRNEMKAGAVIVSLLAMFELLISH